MIKANINGQISFTAISLTGLKTLKDSSNQYSRRTDKLQPVGNRYIVHLRNFWQYSCRINVGRNLLANGRYV